jgi:hypothetical protein
MKPDTRKLTADLLRFRPRGLRSVLVALFGHVTGALAAGNPLDPAVLFQSWEEVRQVQASPPCLSPEAVAQAVAALAARWQPLLRVEEVGRSGEGRPIFELRLGSGAERLLFWSQMHGDEPSATPALLDLAEYLLRNRERLEVEALLERFTLVFVPMLNPDGAVRGTRQNAWGIDLNRDAARLVTPESRLLRDLAYRHRPILGFNLHDQNRRRTAGQPRELAVGSVLAVSGDPAGTVSPERELAMRAAVAFVDAVDPLFPGRVARYDDSWNPRAFGDLLTAAGLPVLLVESGGVPPGTSLAELARFNFVGLGAVLDGLARDRLASMDLEKYRAIPENESDLWVDVLLTGGEVWQPTARGVARFRADLGFDRRISDRVREGCAEQGTQNSTIVELGDGSVFASGEWVDVSGRILTPAFRVGLEGFRRRGWLSPWTLQGLARLGVGEVVWWVEPERFGAGLDWVRRISKPGLPRIRLVLLREELPKVRWKKQQIPASDTFELVLLGLAKWSGWPLPLTDREGFLLALWGVGSLPPLAPGLPADFLVWRQNERGEPFQLEAVWLEGDRMELSSP